MVSPHVAGVAALYLQTNTTASPATVNSSIINASTTGVVTSAGSGSPNRLLYSLFGSAPPPPPPSGTCTEGTKYTGTLSGSGDYDYHPNGTSYYSGISGTHKGCLNGPSGTDFDLYPVQVEWLLLGKSGVVDQLDVSGEHLVQRHGGLLPVGSRVVFGKWLV